MKPILKKLHSPDEFDLQNYKPDCEKPFSCLIQAMFSPEGGEGSESFDIVVCNPKWVAEKVQKSGPLIGRHHLIVYNFSFAEIKSIIIGFAEQCEGANWDQVAEKLSRLGHWEFEDYKP